MKNLHKYFQEAKSGGFGLWKLNFILGIGIPFNKPHRIRIIKLSDEEVITTIPFRRSNFNHIKGIHACGLATAAEYATGLLLLNKLNPASYRIIMQTLGMEYHYQAKSDVKATFHLSDAEFEQRVIEPLKGADTTFVDCVVQLHDNQNNHVATCTTRWQIKDWSKVKTKV
ncbi:MAG: DUF4442 domain-containing protein [Bacteroidota bacterium]